MRLRMGAGYGMREVAHGDGSSDAEWDAVRMRRGVLSGAEGWGAVGRSGKVLIDQTDFSPSTTDRLSNLPFGSVSPLVLNGITHPNAIVPVTQYTIPLIPPLPHSRRSTRKIPRGSSPASRHPLA